MTDNTFDAHRHDWMQREELAERIIPAVGKLYREHGVITSVHGQHLTNLSATAIIAVHENATALGHETSPSNTQRTSSPSSSAGSQRPAPSTLRE